MESQLFILYTSGDGLMYTPKFNITAMLGLLPIISLMVFILKCYFAIKYRRMWAVTSYYKLYPLTMVLLLLNLLFHDVPQAILGLITIPSWQSDKHIYILVYFYYARFKPPSFDLRIENLIQPCIDILIVLLTTVMQGRNVKRYQVLFKTKIVKIGVWLTSVPVLVVTPILKCSIVLSTIFNQLNTYTSGNNFDPLRTEISNITGSTIVTSKVNNEYPSTVDPFLDDFAPVKEWFSPRQTTCVNTKLSKDGGYWRQIAEPNPFASGCVNYIEWLMLSTVVPLVGGVFSLVFLLRKVITVVVWQADVELILF